MKPLFNFDVIEANRIKACPGDYLKSLPAAQQITEAEIGIATAKEFLEKLKSGTTRIYTGDRHE